MSPNDTTTGPDTHTNPVVFDHALLMAQIILLAGYCPHPAVEETEDGHLCRICGRLV